MQVHLGRGAGTQQRCALRAMANITCLFDYFRQRELSRVALLKAVRANFDAGLPLAMIFRHREQVIRSRERHHER
jgi:hypothetical protein